MLRTVLALTTSVAVSFVTVGCGEQTSAPDRPETAAVTVTVTQGGSAVEGATVTFSPTAEGGRGATGITDASGKAQLTTFAAGDGAIPGSYKVSVVKYQGAAAAATASDEDEEEVDEAEYDAAAEESESGKDDSHNLLPPKYADADTSGLTANVKSGEANELTFSVD